jgi:hypothetical protein
MSTVHTIHASALPCPAAAAEWRRSMSLTAVDATTVYLFDATKQQIRAARAVNAKTPSATARTPRAAS